MLGTLGNLGGVSYDIVAEDKTGQATGSAVAGLARVTAAFAAVAAASHYITQATDAYDEMSQTSVLTSAKLGTSVGVINEAVKQAARDNKDFVSDASAAFDLLARSGEDNLDVIAQEYKVFSDLGDITSQSSTAVTQQVIPALKAFGIEVSDVANYQDVFTSVVRNTNMSLGEFTGFISRSALNLKALGLSLEDTAAIFQILNDRGLQGRQAMRVFSDAIQAQSEHMRVAERAALDYARAQEELREAQDKSAMSAQEYAMRMSDVGRDVAAARRLTMNRRIELLRDQANEDKIREKAAAAQAAQTEAESKPFDVFAALGVSEDEIQSKRDMMESNAGLTTALADGVESYQTATERWAQEMEQARLAVGELLDPIKGVTVAINHLSTVLAIIGTGATILQAVGALRGAGGLAGGAGGIAGGLGKAGSAGGGVVPYAVTGTMAEGIEATALAEAGAGAGGVAAMGTGTLLAAGAAGALLGGAVVYGLEELGLLGLTKEGAVRSAGERVGGAAYAAGYETADILKTVQIGAVNLSKDYDFERFMKDMDTYMNIKRMQRGVRVQ